MTTPGTNIVIYDGWCPTHGPVRWWPFPPQTYDLCDWLDGGERCKERLDVYMR